MRKSRPLRGILIALVWLAVWQALSMAVGSALVLPSPYETLRALMRLSGSAAFWQASGGSLFRIVAGYVAAVVAGAVLAALTSRLPFARDLLRPLRSVVKATPVASFILLVELWLKGNALPSFIAFLMVLPMVWANVEEAILAVDQKLLEMARLFRFGAWKTLRLVYLPSVMPALLAACGTGIGFAWKAGVAAEVIARTAGSIGNGLIESRNYLETADMFAWTAAVILLSVLLERGLMALLKRIRRPGMEDAYAAAA